jgi:hypothetical protein
VHRRILSSVTCIKIRLLNEGNLAVLACSQLFDLFEVCYRKSGLFTHGRLAPDLLTADAHLNALQFVGCSFLLLRRGRVTRFALEEKTGVFVFFLLGGVVGGLLNGLGL